MIGLISILVFIYLLWSWGLWVLDVLSFPFVCFSFSFDCFSSLVEVLPRKWWWFLSAYPPRDTSLHTTDALSISWSLETSKHLLPFCKWETTQCHLYSPRADAEPLLISSKNYLWGCKKDEFLRIVSKLNFLKFNVGTQE